MTRTCQHPRRVVRQRLAAERQEKYNSLSLDEKLAQAGAKQFTKLQNSPLFRELMQGLQEVKDHLDGNVDLRTSTVSPSAGKKLTANEKAAKKADHKKRLQETKQGQ